MPKFRFTFNVTERSEQAHTVEAPDETTAAVRAINMFNKENKDLKDNCEVEMIQDGE